MNSIPPLKQCHKCLQAFPATSEFFVTGKGHKDGLRYLCKPCKNAARRKTVPEVLPEGYKRCARCHEVKAHDLYPRRSSNHDGRDNYCYDCRHAIYREQAEKEKDIPPPTQVCMRCRAEKPFTSTFFHRDPSLRYGLRSTCKKCDYESQQAARQADPKRHADYARVRRARNHEHALMVERRWAQANRERRRQQERLRIQANPERFRAMKRRYRQTEHGKLKDRVYTHNRQSRLRGASGRYTVADAKRQYAAQRGRCYWCGKRLGTGKNAYQIDHIVPVTRGGTNDPSNLVIACPPCNQSKNNKLPHEWRGSGGRLL